MNNLLRKTADISECGAYRYRLTRHWNDSAAAMPFVMLNPSTANADVDDPTIRRCMSFARRECAGGIIVVNLWALRATDPMKIELHPFPAGPHNVGALDEVAALSATTGVPIVCAWGANSPIRGLGAARRFLNQGAHLCCLGKTKAGHPRHPLYVRGDQPLEAFP